MPDLFAIAGPAEYAVVYMAFWKYPVHKASSVLFCVFIGGSCPDSTRLFFFCSGGRQCSGRGGVNRKCWFSRLPHGGRYACSVNLALVDIIYFVFLMWFSIFELIDFSFSKHDELLPLPVLL